MRAPVGVKLFFMADFFAKLRMSESPLGQYADTAEEYFIFPKLEGPLGNRMKFRGKEVIVWSINNYLGLGNTPEVRKVDADAARDYGLAYPMGSRMLTGNSDLHDELERQLADFVKKEACVLVNFGYQGIMSAINCLMDRRGRDVIVYDSECHACIVDGIWMSPGHRFKFRHNDMESLEKNLIRATRKAEETGGGILVISEGVFGMAGDQGKLKEIVDLKEKYDFRVLIDDAHGFGTLGETGYGAGEEQNCQDGIDIYFSTFAKSMASIGGFLAGDENVVKFLKYNMRSQIFAKTLPMPYVVGNLKRLEMLRNEPEHKARLWRNVNALQNGLKERGFDIGDTNTCVTPVFMKGSVNEAALVVQDMRENYGIFCSIVVYPVVPKDVLMLRMIPSASHTLEDIDVTLKAFTEIRDKLAEGVYAGQPEIV